MDETEREELKEAYRKEKDPRVAARMLAVHTVYVRKAGIDDAAAHLMRSARWVRNWLHRYDEGGLEGLRDIPQSGRPHRKKAAGMFSNSEYRERAPIEGIFEAEETRRHSCIAGSSWRTTGADPLKGGRSPGTSGFSAGLSALTG